MHMRRRQVDAKAAESRWCRRQEDALSSGNAGGDVEDATAATGPWALMLPRRRQTRKHWEQKLEGRRRSSGGGNRRGCRRCYCWSVGIDAAAPEADDEVSEEEQYGII